MTEDMKKRAREVARKFLGDCPEPETCNNPAMVSPGYPPLRCDHCVRVELMAQRILAFAEEVERKTRDADANVADQYYRHLSANGVTFMITEVAENIRDDIRSRQRGEKGGGK